jgi:hypothetical protein
VEDFKYEESNFRLQRFIKDNFKGQECKVLINGRQMKFQGDCKVNRFQSLSDGWGYGDGTHINAVTFEVSAAIRFKGIGFYTPDDEEGELIGDCKLVVGNSTDGEVLYEQTGVDIIGDLDYEQGQIHKLMFEEAVELEPEVEYSIVLLLKGDNSFYGQSSRADAIGEGGIRFGFSLCKIVGKNNGTSPLKG